MSPRGEGVISLLGGPLHSAGRRARLVLGESNSVPLGLAIGVLSWVILLILAAARGLVRDFFRLEMLTVHLRMLAIIPLLFLAEAVFDPKVRDFVRSLLTSEIVPEEERPAYMELLAWFSRRANAIVPDIICLLMASSLGSTRMGFGRSVAPKDFSFALANDPVLVTFYYTIAMTVFRFLLFRWLWHLGLWTALLWRISRLRLRLIAAHSDRAAGLGGLEIAQLHLIPFIFAIGILNSVTFVPSLLRGMPLEGVYPAAALGVALSLALVYGPMLVFTPKLVECRWRGFYKYMGLATRYVHAFEERWFSDKGTDVELLGAADIQSLADLTNSIAVVREVRVIPASTRLLWATAIASILPLLPLGLFRYSLADLLQRSVARLIGG